jgi:hypothetical protein
MTPGQRVLFSIGTALCVEIVPTLWYAATRGRRLGRSRPPYRPTVGALPRTPNGAWWFPNTRWSCLGCGSCTAVRSISSPSECVMLYPPLDLLIIHDTRPAWFVQYWRCALCGNRSHSLVCRYARQVSGRPRPGVPVGPQPTVGALPHTHQVKLSRLEFWSNS